MAEPLSHSTQNSEFTDFRNSVISYLVATGPNTALAPSQELSNCRVNKMNVKGYLRKDRARMKKYISFLLPLGDQTSNSVEYIDIKPSRIDQKMFNSHSPPENPLTNATKHLGTRDLPLHHPFAFKMEALDRFPRLQLSRWSTDKLISTAHLDAYTVPRIQRKVFFPLILCGRTDGTYNPPSTWEMFFMLPIKTHFLCCVRHLHL